jgi:glycosyltransferase involved in cell wall biosynthesis
MRIAIIITRFLPNYYGGAEISANNIAIRLAARGHEVYVITTLGSHQEKFSSREGIIIHRIKTIELPILRNCIFALRAVLLIKKLNIDIIHSHSVSFHNAGFPAYLIKKILKIPYIVYGLGSDVYMAKGLEKMFRNKIINYSDAAIVLTRNMEIKIQKYTNKPLIIIPNGIDLRIYESVSKLNIYNELNIPSDEKIIVFLGRLHPVKGLDYLIESFYLITNRYQNVSLLIIGKGSELSAIRNLANKYNLNSKIFFNSKVSNKEIPNYLSACNIFVLPSLSEGFPTVVLEAMASGLPIVATNVGGLPDIIQENKNGFLVEPKNPEKMAERILFLLNNPYECKKIGVYNKEYVKNYQWNDVIDKLEFIYNGVLKK